MAAPMRVDLRSVVRLCGSRVDKESLNPMVYTMEELEKGREGLQGLERKEQAIRVSHCSWTVRKGGSEDSRLTVPRGSWFVFEQALKDAIVQGVMPPAPPPPPVMMVNGEPPGVPGMLPVMNPGGPLPQPGVGVAAPLPVITTEPVAMEVDRPPA